MRKRDSSRLVRSGMPMVSIMIIFLCVVSLVQAQDRQPDNGKYLTQISKWSALHIESGNAYVASLKQKVSVNYKQVPLKAALEDIAQKAGYQLSYSAAMVPLNKRVNVNAANATVDKVLWEVLEGTGLWFAVSLNNHLVLMEQPPAFTRARKAQEQIRGTITDAQSGASLPGVNILVKGTTTGTSTDAEGSFELTVPSLQDTLVVSYIGYQTRQVPLDGRTSIDVALQSQAISGEEVVVTALGREQAQRSLSYSTEGVNTEQVAKARAPNMVNALQGKVAGVEISEGGAGIGSPSKVLIRGNRSFTNGDGPLYVIDGVPARGGISDLSPANVESINVLKGPNAAALYGNRAQNGVIIVTTKAGTPGEVQVSLGNNLMFRVPNMLYNFQDEYGQGVGGQYNRRAYASWGPKMEGQMVQHWSPDPDLASTQIPYSPQPNNVSDLFKTGYTESADISASLGTETAQYFFNYTYTTGQGIVPNNTLNRHNVNLRVTSQLSSKLSLDSKLTFNTEDINAELRANKEGTMFYAYRMPRSISTEQASNYEYIDQDGGVRQNTWVPGFGRSYNPYWVANNIQQSRPGGRRVLAFASLTYDITDNLNVMGRASYDQSDNQFSWRINNDTGTTYKDGYFSFSKNTLSELNLEYLLSYEKDLSEHWSINATQGGNIREDRNNGLSANTGDGLVRPNFFTLSNTQLPETSYNPGAPVDIWSLYGSANIGWNNAIFVNLTGRNDWSSTLPSDSRSFFYPSAGVSAVLTDLIPALPDALSFAKIRGSWAKVGNGAPPFSTTRFANFTAGGNNGFISLSNSLPAENLKPEKTISYEVGVELGFYSGRLGLDATAYKSNTRNQLFSLALPVASGASSFFTNGGDVQNEGIEIILNTTPIQTSDLQWNMDVGFSANRSEVLKIDDEREILFLGNNFAVEEGKPFGQIYGRGYQRDDQGRVLIGSNGVPQITQGATVQIADPNPDWMGSLNGSVNYKNINLGFVLEHRQGGTFYSETNTLVYSQGSARQTLQGREGGLVFGDNFFSDETAVLASDGSPNDIAIDAETFWSNMGGYINPAAEPFVVDASNLRLRELTVGYSLPRSLLDNIPSLSGVQLTLAARNVFFLYRAADNVDPNVITGTGKTDQGISDFPPPSVRSFGFDVNINF